MAELNNQEQPEKKSNISKRGFGSMNPERKREIASKGGKAVSRNRDHMANIGKKGGDKVSRDRDYMSKIGRKGGQSNNNKKRETDETTEDGAE